MNLRTQLPLQWPFSIKKNLGIKPWENFSWQVLLCRLQGTFFENMLNCFQLSTLAIMISVYTPHLEIFYQNTMACTKLKQLTRDMVRNATYEIFQLIEDTFLHIALFGWWGGTGGAHLVFYNLIAIHRAEKHGKCLSIFTKLREIFLSW